MRWLVLAAVLARSFGEVTPLRFQRSRVSADFWSAHDAAGRCTFDLDGAQLEYSTARRGQYVASAPCSSIDRMPPHRAAAHSSIEPSVTHESPAPAAELPAAEGLIAVGAKRLLAQQVGRLDPVNATGVVAPWLRLVQNPTATRRSVIAALLLLGLHGAEGTAAAAGAPRSGPAIAAASLSKGLEQLSTAGGADGPVRLLWPLEQPLAAYSREQVPGKSRRMTVVVTLMPASAYSAVLLHHQLLECLLPGGAQCSTTTLSHSDSSWGHLARAVAKAVQAEQPPRLQPLVLQLVLDLDQQNQPQVVSMQQADMEQPLVRATWAAGWRLLGHLKLTAPDSHSGLLLTHRVRKLLVKQRICADWDVVLDQLADTVEAIFNGSAPVPSDPNHQGQYHEGAPACEQRPQFKRLYDLLTMQTVAATEALSVIHPMVDTAGEGHA